MSVRHFTCRKSAAACGSILVVATKNRKKLKEIKELLRGLRIKIISLVDLGSPVRIVENGKTFSENALKKAVRVARVYNLLTLGEDSGLCVNILGGKPGIYSSRFAGKNKNDRENNRKLLRLLLGIPPDKRKAYYHCAVALADGRGLISITEGRCYGRIGFEMRGTSGFGYDPLFIVPGYNKTFAQLGEKVKHSMSHRYRALQKMRRFIQKYIESTAKVAIIKK